MARIRGVKSQVRTTLAVRGAGVRGFEVEYVFGDTLREATSLFGEHTVMRHFRRAATLELQVFVRGLVRRGCSEEEIQRAVARWAPSTGERR